MSKITRNNLQQFCRACLRSLQNSMQPNPKSYNILLMPNLSRLLVLFTTLDISQEDDAYPKSLCQLCYDKLLNYQDFRALTLKSTEILHGFLNKSSGNCLDDNEYESFMKVNDSRAPISNKSSAKRKSSDDCSDDDQLLLPELAPLKTNIKLELFGERKTGLSFPNMHQPYTKEIEVKLEPNCQSIINDDDDDDVVDDEPFLANRSTNNFDSAFKNDTVRESRSSEMNISVPLRTRDRNTKSLYCQICDKQFHKKLYLDAHVRRVHEGQEKPFQCKESGIGKYFKCFNQLHVHSQSHHQSQKYVKNGCERSFKLQNAFNDPPFSTKLQQLLEMHQNQITVESGMEHICQQCFKKYSSKRALSEHLKRHAQIKEHVCKECGVAKVTRTELQTHMRTHNPNLEKFKCSICPQEFNHKNAISRHVRVVHEGQRRFACSFCLKRFGTRNSQICHERLHTGERPFTCNICEKGFTQLEGLKSHMKSHDKSLRRYNSLRSRIDHEKQHLYK